MRISLHAASSLLSDVLRTDVSIVGPRALAAKSAGDVVREAAGRVSSVAEEAADSMLATSEADIRAAAVHAE